MTGKVYVLWVGFVGGGCLGAVIISCVVYGKNWVGVRSYWVSMFDVFWVLSGLLSSVGFFGFRFPMCVCVCVCVCVFVCVRARVAWRILCI